MTDQQVVSRHRVTGAHRGSSNLRNANSHKILYHRWINELWAGHRIAEELVSADFVGHWPTHDVHGPQGLQTVIDNTRGTLRELDVRRRRRSVHRRRHGVRPVDRHGMRARMVLPGSPETTSCGSRTGKSSSTGPVPRTPKPCSQPAAASRNTRRRTSSGSPPAGSSARASGGTSGSGAATFGAGGAGAAAGGGTGGGACGATVPRALIFAATRAAASARTWRRCGSGSSLPAKQPAGASAISIRALS